MSRKFVLILCLLVLFSCFLSTRLNPVEVKASGSYPVHNVNTGLNYQTIQEAIDANETLDGNIIFVEAGTYYEHVIVNKSLSLFGENSTNTFIDGSGVGKVVTISANNTRIRGFNIRGGGFTPWGSDSGIYLRSSNNVVFNNTISENGDWGIWLDSSSGNNTIADNSITDNWRGCMLNNTWGNNLVGNRITNQSDSIYLWNSFNNTIASNIISDNGLGIGFDSSNSNNVLGNNITGNFYGITLLSSPNNTLRSNVLDNNSYGLEVSWFLYLDNQLSYFIQDIDSSNTMNGQPICYLVNHNNEQVPLDVGFVALVNCTNITVRDLNLKNNVQGMILACTNNSRIQNLNITNNRHGIYLFRSYNNVICDSNLSHNSEIGISLESSSENNIVRNNVTRSPEGIFLSDSSSNNITNNYIANNKYRGVVVALSSENNIAYNNVTGNGMAGIGIYSDGKGTLEKNLVQGNNLINNTCGVQLGDTSGNRCYHNNFVNNTEQASVTVSIGSVSYGNVWDNGYPSGGNYWSDYTGIDLFSGPLQNETGADGIGDSWYDRDHYPLMGMFSDFNATQECHVQTICNSAISSFQFNGTAIRFNVSGESGTIGFCRICIPTALMNSPYKVYVNGTQVSYSLLQCSNETYSYLYFNYTHSTQEVIIIPEFPSLFILPIFMTATLLAVIVYKRKQA